MMEDPSDNLLDGLWPFLKRLIMLLLPFWVFLLFYAGKAPLWVATTMAGFSLAPVVIYEKLMLKKHLKDEIP